MKDSIYFTEIDDAMFLNAIKRRREEAEGHWNEKENLKEVREENIRQYLGKYVEQQMVDERYQDIYNDNRQFTSIRTILPFLTARITAAEVTPANDKDLSLQFAEDFENILQRHTDKQMGRGKIRLAVQDVLKGQRVGILGWHYDALLNEVVLEYIDPKTVTIGKRSKQFEEPDYFGRDVEKTVYDLCRMFPDKDAEIKKLFGIQKGVPSQLDKVYKVKEEWMWLDLGDRKELVVGWSWQNYLFGKIKDPNWNSEGRNVTEAQMIPFVFFNFLGDGSGYIDETSFIEQAKYLQRNYNKRGQTIAENAKYGGTGVPIFAKGTISQKDVAKIRFSPIQRVLLNTTDMKKAFTVWQSTPLPNYIVEDKMDLRESIDNIWASNAVLRGQQTDNKTLGQDVLNRDQAEGRLTDPIDCIDDSMTRLYLILAQMMYRYFDEKKYFNYMGDDGRFVSLVVSQADIAKNLGIQINVRAGTSLPIDRAQKRASIMELLKLNKVSTLVAYKELNLFEDPEAAYKQFMLEQVDPTTALSDVEKQVFDREANQDLQMVIGGKQPEEREDISNEYAAYLNEWLLTDKYMLLQQAKPEAAARVSTFVDGIIAKAQRKADKMTMQPALGTGTVPPQVAALVSAQQQPALAGQPVQQ